MRLYHVKNVRHTPRPRSALTALGVVAGAFLGFAMLASINNELAMIAALGAIIFALGSLLFAIVRKH
jgi:hypothetical protein